MLMRDKASDDSRVGIFSFFALFCQYKAHKPLMVESSAAEFKNQIAQQLLEKKTEYFGGWGSRDCKRKK